MIILSVTESTNELISGIPEFLIFETSEPSNIFYTFDNSTPDENSLIAVDKVYLPTNGTTLVVKAIAKNISSSSAVMEIEYKTTNQTINGPRLTGKEGISVLRIGDAVTDSLSFDANGNPSQQTSIGFDDLQMKASRNDYQGIRLSETKTSLDFVNFADTPWMDNIIQRSSPNDGREFDPTANVIIIDGSTEEKMEEQVVKIVNRGYNTFDATTKFYKERLGQSQPIITGNYVKSFYNPATKKYISYYWESLESRWIQSIQTVDIKPLRLFSSSSKNRYVFEWIQERALSQLF